MIFSLIILTFQVCYIIIHLLKYIKKNNKTNWCYYMFSNVQNKNLITYVDYTCNQQRFNTISDQLTDWDPTEYYIKLVRQEDELFLRYKKNNPNRIKKIKSSAKNILTFFYTNKNYISEKHEVAIKKLLNIKYSKGIHPHDNEILEYVIKAKVIKEIQEEKNQIIEEAHKTGEDILARANSISNEIFNTLNVFHQEIEELSQKKEELIQNIADLEKNCLIECHDGTLVTNIQKINEIPFFKFCLKYEDLSKRMEISEEDKKIFPNLAYHFKMKDFSLKVIRQFFQVNENPLSLDQIQDWELLLEFYRFADHVDHPLKSQILENLKKILSPHEILSILTFITYSPENHLIQEFCQEIALNFLEMSTFPDFLKIKHEYLIEILKKIFLIFQKNLNY